jgi:superfamily II DNA or RNA helicase
MRHEAHGSGLNVNQMQLSVDLRAWQKEALSVWRAADRGVVAVVTGGGKTWFALACVIDFLQRRSDTSIVIVVPTVALLDQWVVVLADDLAVPSSDIAMFGGGHHATKPRQFNVMVLNTARKVAPEIAAAHPTFLVVDECHRAASMHNALSLRGTHSATLGLSATPERDFDDLFNEVVVPMLGPVIYRYDYRQALADKVITPFELTNIRVPLTADEQARYDDYTRRLVPLFRQREHGDQVDDRLHRVLRDRARVSTGAALRLPAALKILEANKRVRTIVFHEQIAAADAITSLLLAHGHRAAVYHSGVGAHMRQDNLRLFRRGEIDVLVTCRALDEGINVPDASLAVIVASTASTRQRIQRLGRVLRPSVGKHHAEIFTIYASEPEAERLRREETGLEGVDVVKWQSLVEVR